MQRIKFEYPPGAPTTTLQFVWGLEMEPPTWNVEAGSVMKRAHDGTIYTALKGTPRRLIPLKISLLTVEERDSFINFILNTVEGRLRVFRYTNQDNEIFDVRFLDEDFDFGDGTLPYSLTVSLIRS